MASIQRIKNIRWFSGSSLLALMVILPLLFIIFNGFSGESMYWTHVYENLLGEYLTNTFALMLGAGGLSLLLGVSSAWVVSNYKFPLHRFFEWGLILPLAIPTYIIAFTYSGVFDYSGSYRKMLSNFLSPEAVDGLTPNIVNIYGIIVILALVLYPYVYLTARLAFSYSSSSFIEAAKSLKKSTWETFYKIALPLARPAIVGGVFLVLMEILNDYGAVKYFGINTLTTGIFRMWFSYEDMDAAIRLAAILLLSVLVLLFIERKQRGRKKYHVNLKNPPLVKETACREKIVDCFSSCSISFLLWFCYSCIATGYMVGTDLCRSGGY
jgi:iron(III) transport system permease protein